MNTTGFDDPPQLRSGGDMTIVPAFDDGAGVEGRLILKTEPHIRKRRTSEIVRPRGTLRHQTAMLEHLDEGGCSLP